MLQPYVYNTRTRTRTRTVRVHVRYNSSQSTCTTYTYVYCQLARVIVYRYRILQPYVYNCCTVRVQLYSHMIARVSHPQPYNVQRAQLRTRLLYVYNMYVYRGLHVHVQRFYTRRATRVQLYSVHLLQHSSTKVASQQLASYLRRYFRTFVLSQLYFRTKVPSQPSQIVRLHVQ